MAIGMRQMNSGATETELTSLDVLIAEDDFITALDLAQSVDDLGGEVLGPVAAVSEGLALLQCSRPVLAFLDMQLNDGFVTPLASALDRRSVPFALVTGYQGEELERMPLKQAPRMSKPYRRSDLARMAKVLRAEVIRRRAHTIWEREGRPEGQADRHWLAAEQELLERASVASRVDTSTFRNQAEPAAGPAGY
jgi:two-component system, response regulator PdtaR